MKNFFTRFVTILFATGLIFVILGCEPQLSGTRKKGGGSSGRVSFANGDIVGEITKDENGEFIDGVSLIYQNNGIYTYSFTYIPPEDDWLYDVWESPRGTAAFKLRPVAGDWDVSYGSNGDYPILDGEEVEISEVQGNNICVSGLESGQLYTVIVRCTSDGRVFLSIVTGYPTSLPDNPSSGGSSSGENGGSSGDSGSANIPSGATVSLTLDFNGGTYNGESSITLTDLDEGLSDLDNYIGSPISTVPYMLQINPTKSGYMLYTWTLKRNDATTVDDGTNLFEYGKHYTLYAYWVEGDYSDYLPSSEY